MELEKQVCSLDLAKRLKELGVRQESVFFWHTGGGEVPTTWLGKGYEVKSAWNNELYENVSAFTVAELGEMLPCRAWIEGVHYDLTLDKCDVNWHSPSNGHATKFWYSYERYDNEQHTIFCLDLDAVGKECDAESSTEAHARAKMLIYLLENNFIQA